jgi:hypothetical protein
MQSAMPRSVWFYHLLFAFFCRKTPSHNRLSKKVFYGRCSDCRCGSSENPFKGEGASLTGRAFIPQYRERFAVE